MKKLEKLTLKELESSTLVITHEEKLEIKGGEFPIYWTEGGRTFVTFDNGASWSICLDEVTVTGTDGRASGSKEELEDAWDGQTDWPEVISNTMTGIECLGLLTPIGRVGALLVELQNMLGSAVNDRVRSQIEALPEGNYKWNTFLEQGALPTDYPIQWLKVWDENDNLVIQSVIF